jgi:hypothetical protein
MSTLGLLAEAQEDIPRKLSSKTAAQRSGFET